MYEKRWVNGKVPKLICLGDKRSRIGPSTPHFRLCNKPAGYYNNRIIYRNISQKISNGSDRPCINVG